MGRRKKHMACCEKYKPCILKYKALILKYVPYIFRQKSHLIFSNLQTAVFMPRNSRLLLLRHTGIKICFSLFCVL